MASAKNKVEKDTSERWLLTYSDLMNLLLILFILLYSMANVDIVKYQRVASSLRQAFGNYSTGEVIGGGGGSPSIIDLGGALDPDAVVPTDTEKQQMEAVQSEVQNLVQELGLTGEVSVATQERGIYISIGEQVLFKSGSAELDETARNDIIKIGREILAKMPDKQMRVEGHTDNVPINNVRFPDNQELSTARANNVWRILVKDAGMDPKKISATGYGEYRPLVPNDSEEHMKQNRRVDIVILREIYDVTEPGAEGAGQGNTQSALAGSQTTAQTSSTQGGQ
ncbi:MAG TPA: OmpA family protein [Clostridia bacterium]|nr:OmpA family protein [Clostridia bacterium]